MSGTSLHQWQTLKPLSTVPPTDVPINNVILVCVRNSSSVSDIKVISSMNNREVITRCRQSQM